MDRKCGNGVAVNISLLVRSSQVFFSPLSLSGKAGIQFYTQLKTVTSLWREADADVLQAATVMPTMK